MISGVIGLLFAPQLAARLLLSNTEYATVMLQALGMFMVGLGIIVALGILLTGASYLSERRA